MNWNQLTLRDKEIEEDYVEIEEHETDCIMTVNDFISSCFSNYLIDDDGYGKPMKNGEIIEAIIYPSSLEKIPSDATHIIWYNK